MRVFVIDTDTASDDAVAILMALAAPYVRVAALTTVAGNLTDLRNALRIAENAGVAFVVVEDVLKFRVLRHCVRNERRVAG